MDRTETKKKKEKGKHAFPFQRLTPENRPGPSLDASDFLVSRFPIRRSPYEPPTQN
jgi:hypothetical protein